MTIDAITARRAFLDTVAMGEDNVFAEYNELYGGGHFTSYAAFPQWAGKDNSHAAGRYQFEPATWRGQAAKLGLKDFTPASQDAGAWDLAETVYHALTHGRELAADLVAGTLGYAGSALNSTWTSMSAETFATRFAKALAMTNSPVAPPGGSPAPAPQPAPQPAPAPAILPSRALISAWQAMLDITVDGDPGDETSTALRAYLDQHG